MSASVVSVPNLPPRGSGRDKRRCRTQSIIGAPAFLHFQGIRQTMATARVWTVGNGGPNIFHRKSMRQGLGWRNVVALV